MMLHETCSEIRVRYAETDQMGVVYYANYLVWCEIGRTDFMRSLGRAYAEVEAQGVRLAVSEATVRYRASARYDEWIDVRTRLIDSRSRALTFSYQIVHRERGVLADATTSLVSLAQDGRVVALPTDLRGLMHDAVAPDFSRGR